MASFQTNLFPRNLFLLVAIWLGLGCGVQVSAVAAPPPGKPAAATPPTREIFVPFDDLNVLLEGGTQRIFLTRQEYDDLVAKAGKTPPEAAPQDAALLAADYVGTVEEGRAVIVGTLSLEVFSDGLFRLPLALSGAGLRQADLDGRPAALVQMPGEPPALIVSGQGPHRLTLRLTAPLETTAAQQALRFTVPTPTATRFRLDVPGNVEVKAGAAVRQRTVDQAAGVTHLELVPPRGPMALVMSLNNRLLREQRVVSASSVLVAEVTAAYHRLHATVSHRVLHGAVDSFRFTVPAGFEVTEVASPLIARWEVREVDAQRILEVRLRQATTETVVLNISAVRTPAPLEDWSFPRLEPLDVAGQVAVVGLLVEDRLTVEEIAASGLIAIDNQILTAALPESLLEAEPGAPRIRPVVAYYAPQAKFDLTARFEQPAARLAVTTNLLWALREQQQEMHGGFALAPEVEKLFAFDFAAPALWHVDAVTDAQGQPLAIERYPLEDGRQKIHVRLPAGVVPGDTFEVHFHAAQTPQDWLGNWTKLEVAYPVFAPLGATRDVGAISVQTHDDLIVRPDKLQGLSPLDEQEKQRYGLGAAQTALAYRYDGPPYSASLVIERSVPRITARVYSFLRIAPDGLAAHYELVYDVQEARTRRLAFELPGDTPQAISIRGLDGVTVKESTSEMVVDRRRWTALLADAATGPIRLEVDFQQPLATDEPKNWSLPLPSAEGVAYQSGLVAVEGHSELDVQLVDAPRKVDVGELAAAEYQPGRRLLGSFGYLGAPAAVKVDVFRRPIYALPATIIERAELVTLFSASGESQTAARYLLRTKSLLLEIRLPAGAELWSIYLDQTPAKPQRDGDRLLLALPVASAQTLRDLQIVYQLPTRRVGLVSQLDLPAPRLLFRAADGVDGEEVPAADLVWRLVLPTGYRVVQSRGTVFTEGIGERTSPVAAVASTLVALGGGVHPFYGDFTLGSAQMAASRSPSSYASSGADVETASRPTGYFASDDLAAAPEPTLADPFRPQADMLTLDQSHSMAVPETEMPTPAQTNAPNLNFTVAPTPTTARVPGNEPADMPMEQKAGESAGDRAPNQTLGPGSGPVYRRNHRSDALYKSQLWALEGVASLKIDLEENLRHVSENHQLVTFQSLGADPRLEATLVQNERLGALAWGVALVVGLVGLWLTNRAARVKAQYVAVVLLVAAVLPLATGWVEELGDVFDLSFYTGCLLVPYYLLVAGGRRLCACCCPATLRPTGVSAAATLLAALAAGQILSGTAAQAAPPDAGHPMFVIPIEPPVAPVKVPDDAILIPYDPQDPQAALKAEKLLVPYATYEQLWNRAHPDQKLTPQKLPAEYALAGAVWQAVLAEGDQLLLKGEMQLELFTDKVVTIPLGLEGGVLESALLDGQPARIQLVQPQPLAQQTKPAPNMAPAAMQQAANPTAPPAPPRNLLALYASGQGRKRLTLTVRLHLERQGGWRVAQGRIPAAPAAVLSLTVPAAATEVRLAEVPDRATYETKQADEVLEVALGSDGQVNLQWRPKVAEAQLDQSLTAASDVLLDVREDGLRTLWQLNLEFRRGKRETFTLTVPGDFLVERIVGGNVRGWQAQADGARQKIDVTLLQAAQDRETLTVHLSRRTPIGADAPVEFDAPLLTVQDAAQHQGRLTVRRSPLLEVRVLDSAGMVRTDLPAELEALAAAGDDAQQSPLGVRPFQAYRFVATPYALRLAAQYLPAQASAQVQTLLKIAERERTLESRLGLSSPQRPLHQVQLYVPEDLRLDSVTGPGGLEWAITRQDGRRLLTVHLSQGYLGEFSLVLNGALGQTGVVQTVPLPQLSVLDVQRQTGDIVVQLDPALNAAAENLAGCESVLLDQIGSWLEGEQRSLARLALRYRAVPYSGTLRISPRSARVTSYTITNVRVTDRVIEETILLEFTIREAGLREVAFRLPAWMKDARIQAPLLRQKIVTPLVDEQGVPLGVRLVLQDDVIGQLRVLVEHDRLAGQGQQSAPIPVVETGRTDVQYVALESAGRDEVVVVRQQGLDSVAREQQAWRTMADILGSKLTQTYVVRPGVADAELVYDTKVRTAVATAGARIGLAQTLLIVDGYGAYRAVQEYRVDNSTEQFLEIELPDGAELWTAQVAGEPVKPVEVAGTPGQVRIPLVKTAAGDPDYVVTLKYGGHLPSPGAGRKVVFPLIRTVNINVELSQVRLRLPETHQWFDFQGTMQQTRDRGDLAAGVISYLTKELERNAEVFNSESSYSKVRARHGYSQLRGELDDYRRSVETFSYNTNLQQALEKNTGVLQQADLQIQTADREKEVTATDNRKRLNDAWRGQENGLANNVVGNLGTNFDAKANLPAAPDGTEMSRQSKLSFQHEWLEKNKLQTTPEEAKKPMSRLAPMPGEPTTGLDKKEGQGQGQAFSVRNAPPQPAKIPPVVGGKDFDRDERGERDEAGRSREENAQQLAQRYDQRLQEQQRQSGTRGAQVNGGRFQYGGGFQQDGAALSLAQPTVPQGEVLLEQDGQQATAAGDVSARGPELASLDVNFAERGVEYLFTTPRGDIEITARAVSLPVIDRLIRVAWVAGALVLVVIPYRLIRRGNGMLASRTGGIVLLVAGVASLLSGTLPLAGLIAGIVGLVLLVRHWRT